MNLDHAEFRMSVWENAGKKCESCGTELKLNWHDDERGGTNLAQISSAGSCSCPSCRMRIMWNGKRKPNDQKDQNA